jgi:hypothetical protein
VPQIYSPQVRFGGFGGEVDGESAGMTVDFAGDFKDPGTKALDMTLSRAG